ncbi:MAG: SMP-30/gluconolactonase/LRE family protein [Planctomycetota bacterium]
MKTTTAFLFSLAFVLPAERGFAITPEGDIEKVASGFAFTEGPAFDPSSGLTYFTDIPNTTIHTLDGDGNVGVLTKDSKHANGLMVRDGKLFACEMDGQLVSYDLKTGKRSVLAEQHEGARFNACNDMVLDAFGGIYFTDPLFRAPLPLPQGAQAVYYLSSSGDVKRLTGDLPAPNGIALSPDGKTLYVAPSKSSTMLACQVQGPGNIGEPQPFVDVQQPEGKSNTGGDGMTVDVEGNLYFTTHRGVEIVSPDGKSLSVIEFPQQPANVTFVGADRKTLLVTARTSLYQVRMPIAGFAGHRLQP